MPTNSLAGGPLRGLDAELASMPLADAPRGGIDGGFDGTYTPPKAVPAAPGAPPPTDPTAPADPLQGKGPLLEADDAQAFKHIDALVKRQEQLAKNRYAQDLYWTYVKRGWGHLFQLEKVQDRDVWKCSVAPGVNTLSLRPVPNRGEDLCNNVVEILMVDPPRLETQAENDSEEAERAAEMAEEFLAQDGGEAGTRDARWFWKALGSATSTSAAFLSYYVDRTGGGHVPLQIKAHPQATDPRTPLIWLRPDPSGAVDPTTGQPVTVAEPTTSPVLRYVATDEQGNPTQFVDDPSQAGRQWLPKIVIERWKREHVRTFPESADVGDAECVIGLFWTTIARAKYRWPDTIGALGDAELSALTQWQPLRGQILLPASQRTRSKQETAASDDLEGGANDERALCYYAYYRKACPLYPEGAQVFVSGAAGGRLLGRDTLAAMVPAPDGKGQQPKALDIPLVQIDLVLDEDDDDPMGRALIARFGGSTEASAALIAAFLEAIDIILHPATYATVTSPVTGDDVVQSRATGDHIPVLSKEDFPFYEVPRPLPSNFLDLAEWLHEQQNASSGVTKPAMGADKQQEVSGVARQVAVRQALVALSRMQQSVNGAWQRHGRIKLQLAMANFTVPQMLRIVGEDGAAKQEWWTGVDFSRVVDVGIQPGTGTLFPPQDKLQYIAGMQQLGYVSPDDAADAARPTFAQSLGIPDNKQQQRAERQVSAWLKGPPDAQWLHTAQQYSAYQQAVAPIQQQEAALQEQAAQVGAPPPPPPQLPPAPPAPWTPFGRLPMDLDPPIALLRKRRLADLMATARFSAQPPEWQQLVVAEYVAMAQASAPPPMPAPGAPGQPGQPGPSSKPGVPAPGGPHGAGAKPMTPNDAAKPTAPGAPPAHPPTPQVPA